MEASKESGEGEEEDEKKKALGPLVTEIVLRSRDYVELDHLIKVDTKYRRLRKILTAFLREHPNEKVIVFSAFHANWAISERLEKTEFLAFC